MMLILMYTYVSLIIRILVYEIRLEKQMAMEFLKNFWLPNLQLDPKQAIIQFGCKKVYGNEILQEFF